MIEYTFAAKNYVPSELKLNNKKNTQGEEMLKTFFCLIYFQPFLFIMFYNQAKPNISAGLRKTINVSLLHTSEYLDPSLKNVLENL